MKLAEALLLRADQVKKLASLTSRISKNVMLQEGETPQEEVSDLISQAFFVLTAYEENVANINRVNQIAKLPDGRMLGAALLERDTLKARHALLIGAIAGTHKEVDRYSSREIKWVPQIKVVTIQKQADDISQNLRHLNVAIQAANWQIEI